jgi:hypothetical protein
VPKQNDLLTRAREVLPTVSRETGAIIGELIIEVQRLRGQPFLQGDSVTIKHEYIDWYMKMYPGVDLARELKVLDCRDIVVYAIQDRVAFRFFADWLIKIDKLAEM